MKKRFWPLFILLMLATGALRAGEVSGLYSSQLLVPVQQGAPAASQLADGLAGVLIKVSGSRNVLGKPVVQQALQAPDALLRGYAYRKTGRAVADASGTQQPAQALALDFDTTLVDKLLRQANERPMGAQRPTLMLWLAAEQQNQRDYLSADNHLLSTMMNRAATRGLPVQLPLYDLTDQQNLPVSDLWGLFRNGIEQASSRYRPDATLAGRMTPLPGGNWSVDWLLLGQGAEQRFTTQGSSEEALGAAVEQVSDKLFVALTGTSDSNYMEGLQLDVTNVRTLADYAAVVGYLNRLTMVTAVVVEQVEGTRLLLRVQLEGRVEQLERAVRLEPRMAPVNAGVPVDENRLFLRYRWQG